jgi:hypothetical protein
MENRLAIGQNVNISDVMLPEDVEIRGEVLMIGKGFAMVRLTELPEKYQLVITEDGKHKIMSNNHRPSHGEYRLVAGDVDAFCLSDIKRAEPPQAKTLSRDEAIRTLGKHADLDWCINSGIVRQLPGDKFYPLEIETVVTLTANIEAENRRTKAHTDNVIKAQRYVESLK